MNKTKIEWCDCTWNPVTGCLHGCEYCYARRIAERFGGQSQHNATSYRIYPRKDGHALYELSEPVQLYDKNGKLVTAPYPCCFEPAFYRYRLEEPQCMKKPQNIFVCSMADLFGDWVPDEWIDEVFAACGKAPQHRYLFLTKNPSRYQKLSWIGKLPVSDNYWYGSTVTNINDLFWCSGSYNTFLSIEPILGDFPFGDILPRDRVDWVIIGAMTGPDSKKHQPTPETVYNIATPPGPVFMKDSLISIVGKKNMRREFSW